MAAKEPLTAEEKLLARVLVMKAQHYLSIVIDALREYATLTEDDKIFRIIHTLEERHSKREDTLGAAFNLDDVLAYLPKNETLS